MSKIYDDLDTVGCEYDSNRLNIDVDSMGTCTMGITDFYNNCKTIYVEEENARMIIETLKQIFKIGD